MSEEFATAFCWNANRVSPKSAADVLHGVTKQVGYIGVALLLEVTSRGMNSDVPGWKLFTTLGCPSCVAVPRGMLPFVKGVALAEFTAAVLIGSVAWVSVYFPDPWKPDEEYAQSTY